MSRTVAKGCTNIARAKTYVFGINFQCLADDIDQAIDCFQENARLFYRDMNHPAGRTCPLISIESYPCPSDDMAARAEKLKKESSESEVKHV